MRRTYGRGPSQPSLHELLEMVRDTNKVLRQYVNLLGGYGADETTCNRALDKSDAALLTIREWLGA